MRETNNIFRLLPQSLRQLAQTRSPQNKALVKAWNLTMEPMLVRHSRPMSLKNGELKIAVDSPLWANRLRHAAIVDKLKQQNIIDDFFVNNT